MVGGMFACFLMALVFAIKQFLNHFVFLCFCPFFFSLFLCILFFNLVSISWMELLAVPVSFLTGAILKG